MPRHRRPRRSPRYAPEALEARLNPSGLAPVAAEVYLATVVPPPAPVPVPDDGTTLPPAGPGDPPIGNPSTPIGPALPG